MSTVNVGSALPAGTNIIGNIKIVDTGGVNQLAVDVNNNGHFTIYNAANAMAVDSSNNAHVALYNGANALSINAGGNAAINLVQVGGNAVPTGTGASGSGVPRVTVSNDSTIGSNAATGSAVPANAFYQAGLAKTALPTAATDGNLTGEMVDKFGRQVVLPNAMRDLVGSQTTTVSNTTETTIVTATASVFHDLTAITASNTSATAVRVDFRDTTGGSIIFQLYLPAGDTRGIVFQTPQPQTSVNTNWTAQLSAAVTDVRFFAQFIKNQ